MKTNKTPLRGKYLVQNPKALKWIKRIDAFLAFYIKKISRVQGPSALGQRDLPLCNPGYFKKVLVCNIGHLGDVVAATGIFETIKKNCPDCKIGMLVSSGSKCVVEGHSLIDKVHVFDHFKINRSARSFFKKILAHIFSSKRVKKELKEERYDAAVDLYYFFPNAIPLLYRAKIPIRAGYTSGGFGPMLTHGLEWQLKDHYIGFYHLELLKRLGMKIDGVKPKPQLEDDFLAIEETLKEKLSAKALERGYVIFHVGAGHSLKEWSDVKWGMLLKKAVKKFKGMTIVFTGSGEKEDKQIQKIIGKEKNCLNLCSQLGWQQFSLLVKKAKMVVCVDTAIVHLAAAWNKTAIVLYSGINNYHHWRYPSENILALMKPVTCAFCYNNKGCEKMSCISDISIDAVFESMKTILEFEKEYSNV